MNKELNKYDDEIKFTVVPSVLDTMADKVINSEHLANGKSSSNTHTPENYVNKKPIETIITMNTNNDYLFNVTKTDSDTLIISQNINGENEQIINLHQGNIEIKQSHEILANNNHVNTEPLHETNECQEINVMNGTEINHGSDDESCEYLDDPIEDPISTLGSQEPGRKVGSFEIVAINRYHSSDENSSDSSGSEEDLIVGDTVSLTSDSENSKDNEVIIIDNELTYKRNINSKSTEIHEIGSDVSDNDDCVLTAVEKVHKMPKKMQIAKPVLRSELRRSSRAIKRKTYSETDELQDKSDDIIKEVILGDGEIPLTWKIIDDYPTPSKQSKLENITKFSESKTNNLAINEKNDSTVSRINSPANPESSLPAIEPASSVVNHNNSESIASQGTSVSTNNVETKTVATQATEVSPGVSILPTLTDDMFVVEAPSFVVPYVYEKPPIVPFKDFVDKWGNEIKEEEVKKEKEALEKKKAEKVKRQQERKVRRDNGEEVEESEEELTPEEVEKKKAQKAARKERRRRKKEEDEDDLSWDGSSSEESDDSLSEDDSQSAVIDKASLINDLSTVSKTVNPDNYFNLSLGKFFINIGTNLVQEFVQTDLLHQEKRKLIRENRAGRDTKKRKNSIAQLTKNLEQTQASNTLYKYEYKKCDSCEFKSESAVVLANHMQTPNLCKKIIGAKVSKNILNIDSQIEKNHGNKGSLDCEPAPHQCPNCPFEDHTNKSKVARHVIACARKFKTETNLAPPVEWEHPAKIPKPGRARAPVPYRVVRLDQNQMDASRAFRPRISAANTASTPPLKPRVPGPAVPLPVPVRMSGLTIIRPVPASTALNAGVFKKQVKNTYIISTAPQQAGPIQPINAANAKGVVMCEICDGYIKDLEQLRNHMQWIHKIKIHPKMIYNRPPLNCQKCQFRFFTDQGLERHLLGSHGLVTSAIQEAANKGKDAGRCPVCGRAYQRKLLAHISRDHNVVLKPAHLSYKCTVCSSTFGMYRQFESHVYSVHSMVAKKAIDKKTTPAAKASENDSAPKQLKIGDEVSVAPVPVKNSDSAKDK